MAGKPIGSLWRKESKKGLKYFSGIIEIDNEKVNIVGFKNNKKKNENSPDVLLYVSEQKKEFDDNLEDDLV